MNFGDHIKELREEKKLSGRELARRAHISQAYLSQLERGENKNPSPDIIRKLADGLNVDHNDLMTLAGYIDETEKVRLETESIKRSTELIKKRLLKAQETYNMSRTDLEQLLSLDFNIYFRDKLLTKEDKQKLLTIIKTLFE